MFEDLREQMIFQALRQHYLTSGNYYVERAALPGERTGFESKHLLSSSTNYFLNLSLGFFICETEIIIFTS